MHTISTQKYSNLLNYSNKKRKNYENTPFFKEKSVRACVCKKNVVSLRAFCGFMIEYIKGILTDLNPTQAVIEAAGVGYALAITLPTYSALIGNEDKEVKLFVTEIIREDTHEIYGFTVRAERQLFELLMTVSGVGAATARMILSAFTAEELRMLIATGNSKGMAKVKGLGPKTAQRIIVDLKDKALKLDLGGDPTEPPMAFDDPADSGVKVEAVSALTMLGFNATASGKAVDKILKADPTLKVEAVIRQALTML